MKIKLILILSIILSLFALSFNFSVSVFADDDDVNDLQDKIEKYEKKIAELQGKASTLANEIDYMNSRINLTELKIQDSIKKIAAKESHIEELKGDIFDLAERIDKLQKSIDYQTSVLQARLRERYKSREDSPIVFFMGSQTLGELVHKSEYLKVMGLQDNKMIDDMSKTKQSFTLQKKLYEDKKDEEEELKASLEVEKNNLNQYKADLENQRVEKENFLKVTQNDESKYQQLLEDALRELRQIQGAANVVIRKGNAVDVEEGEVIGTMGNSGNSTGPHLHFGVYKYNVEDFQSRENWSWYYNNYKNPLDKLEPKTVYWDTGCSHDPSGREKSGKGKWEWPMSDVRITQNYGSNTCYNWMYGGNPHPALDMVGMGDISIRAVEDGEAYFCRNCLGDGGNGVFIFHDDGYMTLYWHLQ